MKPTHQEKEGKSLKTGMILKGVIRESRRIKRRRRRRGSERGEQEMRYFILCLLFEYLL